MRRSMLLIAGAGLALACPAVAQTQASGMIEDLAAAPRAGVETMDFVFPGQRIVLGPEGRLTLSYFSSCRVEAIRGGTVTIGQSDSRVEGGALKAETRPCDPRKFAADVQTAEAGAAVKRLDPFDRPGAGETMLSSLRPVFRWPEGDGAMVRLFAVDTPTPRLVWSAKSARSWAEYPDGAAPLQPHVPYLAQILTADGRDLRAAFVIDPQLGFADTLWNRTVLVRP